MEPTNLSDVSDLDQRSNLRIHTLIMVVESTSVVCRTQVATTRNLTIANLSFVDLSLRVAVLKCISRSVIHLLLANVKIATVAVSIWRATCPPVLALSACWIVQWRLWTRGWAWWSRLWTKTRVHTLMPM